MFFTQGLDDGLSEFHERLEKAYATSSLTPNREHGRYVWISNKLGEHGGTASPESVRKWFAGMTKPRGATMGALAAVLGVTQDWLEHGIMPDASKLDDAIPDHLAPKSGENDFIIDFEDPEFDQLTVGDRSQESRENATAAGLVSARLMFAGIQHRMSKSRILVEDGSKAREIAVVLMHKVANRGGAWVARMPEARSGFEPYTTSFDMLMFVMPRGGREPALFIVKGKAAPRLGIPEQVIDIREADNNGRPQIILKADGKTDVPVDPIRDLGLLEKLLG